MGKLRPSIIYQTNFLNENDHPTTIVIPLSTYLIDGSYPLRYRLQPRGKLERESDAVLDQIRALDNKRIIPDLLATLKQDEIEEIDKQISLILDL